MTLLLLLDIDDMLGFLSRKILLTIYYMYLDHSFPASKYVCIMVQNIFSY